MPAAGKLVRAASHGRATASGVAAVGGRVGRNTISKQTGIATMIAGGGFKRGTMTSLGFRASSSTRPARMFATGGKAGTRSTKAVAKRAASSVASAGVSGGRGKFIAGAIAGAGIFGAIHNRSGRAIDKMSGRPTGVYGY